MDKPEGNRLVSDSLPSALYWFFCYALKSPIVLRLKLNISIMNNAPPPPKSLYANRIRNKFFLFKSFKEAIEPGSCMDSRIRCREIAPLLSY